MRSLLTSLVLLFGASTLPAEDLDYHVPDPNLKVVKLDTADTESFLGIQLDTEGRMFVGSRAALFVYEPQPDGSYAPRKELLRFPDHTWVYDIAIRGNDLYLLTVSALYVVPEGRLKRDDLKIHRLVWGLPLGHVHQCFHGLAIGPEGDLYFASGDPLWYYGDFTRPDHWGHWTMFSKKPAAKFEDRDWVKTPYTGVGAVWKCRPDGSDLQVYARGLRNSCGLAFDHDWNLFTNDNDHESMPSEYVPGRLNHVTPHADFSWPRGWMKTKTPDRADLLDTMNPNLGRFVPVGQSYYDDPYLGEEYRHSLLVARWCTRKITYYPLKRKGATFECEEKELLVGRDQARPVHVTVGRGGRIFASICYMAQNEGSPVYKSDLVMITRKDDPEGRPFEAYEATKAETEQLVTELASDSWSRRLAAHAEIIRRGDDQSYYELASAVLNQTNGSLRRHLPYIQEVTPRGVLSSKHLANPDAALANLHSLRARPTEYRRKGVGLRKFFDTYAHGDDPIVRLALLSELCGRSLSGFDDVHADVAEFAAGDDAYVRQIAASAIAEHFRLPIIREMTSSRVAKRRLAAVLAVGFRLTRPKSIGPVPEGAPLTAWRTEDAYKIHYADEAQPIDIRTFGLPIGLFTTAEHWKTLKHTEEQEQLFSLLMERLEDSDEQVKLQAAYFLSLLNDPRSEPKVVAVRTDIAKRRLGQAGPSAVTKAWVVGPFPDAGKGFDTVHPVESGSLDPSRTYEAGGEPLAWKDVAIMRQINFRELHGPCDDTSSYAYFRLESGTKQTGMLSVGSDDGVKVWQNGTPVFTNDVSRGALPLQDTVLVSSSCSRGATTSSSACGTSRAKRGCTCTTGRCRPWRPRFRRSSARATWPNGSRRPWRMRGTRRSIRSSWRSTGPKPAKGATPRTGESCSVPTASAAPSATRPRPTPPSTPAPASPTRTSASPPPTSSNRCCCRQSRSRPSSRPPWSRRKTARRTPASSSARPARSWR